MTRPCDCLDRCGDDPALADGRAIRCSRSISQAAAFARLVARQEEENRLLAALGFAHGQTLEALRELHQLRCSTPVGESGSVLTGTDTIAVNLETYENRPAPISEDSNDNESGSLDRAGVIDVVPTLFCCGAELPERPLLCNWGQWLCLMCGQAYCQDCGSPINMLTMKCRSYELSEHGLHDQE